MWVPFGGGYSVGYTANIHDTMKQGPVRHTEWYMDSMQILKDKSTSHITSKSYSSPTLFGCLIRNSFTILWITSYTYKFDSITEHILMRQWDTGFILYMRPANERWHYNVTSSLIGWAHTQNDPWRQQPIQWVNLSSKRYIMTMDFFKWASEWLRNCSLYINSIWVYASSIAYVWSKIDYKLKFRNRSGHKSASLWPDLYRHTSYM